MITPRILCTGSEQYLPYAKSKYRSCLSLAEKTGGYASHYETLENDDLLLVEVTPFNHKIILSGSSTELVSGITNLSAIEVTVVNEKEVKKLKEFYPSSMQAIIDKSERGWTKEKRIAIDPIPENMRITNVHGLEAGQTASVCPAMYTGAMIYAVQLAMGLKNNRVQYRHDFGCTHGVFMDGKTPWLIEISEANGVMAKKLTGFKKAKSKGMDEAIKSKFPMIPDGIAFPTGDKLTAAVEKGKVKILLPAGDLADFYSKDAFFGDCGWAFNKEGTQAVNTAWNWPDNFKRGYLYSISISGNSSGPSNASITKVEDGILYCGNHIGDLPNSHLYFPNGDGCKLESFDATKAGFSNVGPFPTDKSWSTPVYAFFSDSGLLNVYKQVFKKNYIPARTAGWNPFDPSTMIATPYYGGGIYTNASAYANTFTTYPGNEDISVLDFSGPGITFPTPIPRYDDATINYRVAPTGPLAAISVNDGEHDVTAFAKIYAFNYFSHYRYGYSKEEYNSLSISPRNRSCVFISKVKKEQWDSESSSNGNMGFGALCGDTTETTYRGVKDGMRIEKFGSIILPGAPGNIFWLAPRIDPTTEFEISPAPSWFFTNGQLVGGISDNFIWEGYDSFNDDGSIFHYSTINKTASFSGSEITPTYTAYSGAKGSMDVTMKVKFHDGEHDREMNKTSQDELLHYDAAFEPSPDAYGSYLSFNSGYSAFLGSKYYSKYPNLYIGDGLVFETKDGEPSTGYSELISWVGYS